MKLKVIKQTQKINLFQINISDQTRLYSQFKKRKNNRRKCLSQLSHAEKISPSIYAEVFDVQQKIFRNSAAFTFPKQITERPWKKMQNSYLKNHYLNKDFQQAKSQQIHKMPYINTYRNYNRKPSGSTILYKKHN